MGTPLVEQNIYYAMGLAAFGGFLQVLAVLVLAYPDYHSKRGIKYSHVVKKKFILLNLFLQILLGLVNTVSTWFGPVSIIMPTRVSSQLLSNMLLFDYMGIEKFTKDVRVGTYIVVSGAFILPTVGPTIQPDQDVLGLFESRHSMIWSGILVACTFISGYVCVVHLITKASGTNKPSPYMFSILLTARVMSAVLSTSLAKLLVSLRGTPLIIALGGFLASSIVISCASFLQATEVDQKIFVPASACGIQFVNAVTGIIIWQDWLVIQSWLGYVTVMGQILIGVYLISSLDFSAITADDDYSFTKTMSNRIERRGGVSFKNLVLADSFHTDEGSEEEIDDDESEGSFQCERGLSRISLGAISRDSHDVDESLLSYETDGAERKPLLSEKNEGFSNGYKTTER